MSVGLRERKKAATRQALHDAAVRLALEHGVENLTVEAIADAAFVSRRTFSNYFSSKEQALLHRDRTHVARLVELVRARPERESPLEALTAAAEQLSGEWPESAADEQRYRTLRLHPALLGELVTTYAAIERDLATAVEQRFRAGPDAGVQARALAAAYLAVLRVVGQAALEQPDRSAVDLLRLTTPLTWQSLR
ncbi:TetR/AcrR family transcriptional regulator [Streptomyces sp. NPDC059743]|uniref:TetR/AcrR family transcriptional regulator n=1 Tax=Streptomyces sp. NPDC059743 TaxID=3346928 RepID=UPI00365B01CF